MNNTSKLKMLHQKTQEKRTLMKTVCYDASVENKFFTEVKDSVYRMITEENNCGIEKR